MSQEMWWSLEARNSSQLTVNKKVGNLVLPQQERNSAYNSNKQNMEPPGRNEALTTP